jgi:transcription antitermination factor NusG
VEVPQNQIIAIKKYITDTDLHDVDCENIDFKEGELVRIKSGQMKDLIGRFVKINGKHRVVIDIEAVGQSLPINIARSNIEAVK